MHGQAEQACRPRYIRRIDVVPVSNTLVRQRAALQQSSNSASQMAGQSRVIVCDAKVGGMFTDSYRKFRGGK
jgi:hypothetical protein